MTPLAEPVEFQVKYVGPSPLPAEDQKQLAEFQKQIVKLQRDLTTATAAAGEMTTRLEAIKTALDLTPNAPPESRDAVRKLIAAHRETVRKLTGDAILNARNENVPMSISDRVGVAGGAAQTIVAKPTGTQREQFAIARKELDAESAVIRQRMDTQVKELEALLDKLGAPYTPGRLPGGK